MVVGCVRGFEIVDLFSNPVRTQALVDSDDYTLQFISSRESSKPLALFRVSQTEFLLCYQGRYTQQ